VAGTSPFEHYDKDQQVRVPFEHYARLYRSLDPLEISRRCALSFDEAASAFSLRILGSEHRALFPDFALLDPAGRETDKPYEKILFIHYLCEGKFFPSQGRRLAYNEIPWGNVYYRNFEGRCLKRCAFAFGRDLPAFRRLVEGNAALRAEPLATGDAGYRIEFINGLYISLMLWAADDEFPPSAQILFDDNFVFAFTAEDLAAVGDVLIGRLKGMEERS
jgi:hypothetical protein